jgi:tetratricopeptide (TPR) repeat protein
MPTDRASETPPQPTRGAADSHLRLAAYVRHELLQLVVLLLAALGLYAATGTLEQWRDRLATADEQAWFSRGEVAAARHDPAAAIAAFKRGGAGARGSRDRAIALARALVANHQPDDARELLMARRLDAPEDTAINLELARIAVQRNDVTEAIRFFNDVLYAPPAEGDDPAHPQLRLELATFLVEHRQPARAVSELMVAAERPLSPAERLAVGRLFEQAGELEKALAQYAEVRRAVPGDAQATFGAARVLAALQRYRQAQPLFHAVRDRDPAARDQSEVVDQVLALDPLATGLSRAAREARLRAIGGRLHERLSACAVAADLSAERDARRAAIEAQWPARPARRSGGIAAAAAALDNVQRWLDAHCPATPPVDRALTLIADAHERQS